MGDGSRMDTTRTARRTLLLVEDDPGNRLTLSVLLDSRLGDGDGRSLIPLVRAQVPTAKLVLVTGLHHRGAPPPVDAVFQKGRSFAELLACLRGLLVER